MKPPIRILLQTTIPATEDDWQIERFSLLQEHLGSLRDDLGRILCEITARNRDVEADGSDKVLSQLDATDFDELWLFAVDSGDGLSAADCRGITRFRKRGGGILTARDHQDLGSSLCALYGVGRAHFFHTKHQDPDESRHVRDDDQVITISWPNYHSGRNGDYQRIIPVEPVHELLRNPASASGVIEYFPAHPHEGGVGVCEGEIHARVIATGVSQTTHRLFNLVVTFDRARDERGNILGRAIAESSFHHFADYNWDIAKGCPSFVDDPAGEEIRKHRERLADIKSYVRNVALWLAS
ncbi:MAG TPA: hypothetical protein VEG25_00555 [Burkholderiales bacterium]|nr:hypothetical protein [Burkholderiales bacterium]